jgi:hypothetical protein
VIRLLVVGDGERDAAVVPRLVEGILALRLETETRRWARLHGNGRGYAKKFQFAAREARDLGVQGLVAVVDADREGPGRRLKELKAGREADRQKLSFPAALGEANPHLEAWLLDDPTAVREELRLPATHDIPSVRKVTSPKETIDSLMETAGFRQRERLGALAAIAVRVDPNRCQHGKETGYDAFLKDVKSEIAPLAGP